MQNSKPKKPRRHVRGRITKRLILKAATELFIAQGFVKTRISDISGNGQVGYGTVYSHYKNKDEILYSIIDNLLYPYYLTLAKEPEPIDSLQAREFFKKVTLALLDIADNNKEIVEVYYDAFPTSEILTGHWRSNLSDMTDNVFKKMHISSEVEISKGLDHKMVTKTYMYLIDRFILGIVKGTEDDIERIANTIESIMFDGAVES